LRDVLYISPYLHKVFLFVYSKKPTFVLPGRAKQKRAFASFLVSLFWARTLQAGWQRYKKCIYSMLAFGPYFSVMKLCNALRNRKPQAVAVALGARLIYTIKALENIL
jgi:hypothetical protein